MSRPLAVYTDIVDTDPGPGIAMLRDAGFEVRVSESARPADLVAAARDADALLLGYAGVDRALLGELRSLRLVATQSVGYEMVDVDACRERGIWVTNVPDAATEEVATHALAMTLALLRGLPLLARDVRSGRWDGTLHELRRPSEVTVGVVGLGRIGRRYVEYVRPIVGRVVGYDPFVRAMDGVQWLDLDEVMRVSDVVSLHLPLSEETRALIDDRRLGLLRRGAMIINVARAGLIDHDALLDRLDAGHISGAALDVLPEEPPRPDDRLVHHPSVLVTPHSAYLSAASSRDYVVQQARNVVEWYRRGSPESPVVQGVPRAAALEAGSATRESLSRSEHASP
ncbi:MAG: C-terminal binding protein [Dermatophilaceae bacterium]